MRTVEEIANELMAELTSDTAKLQNNLTLLQGAVEGVKLFYQRIAKELADNGQESAGGEQNSQPTGQAEDKSN